MTMAQEVFWSNTNNALCVGRRFNAEALIKSPAGWRTRRLYCLQRTWEKGLGYRRAGVTGGWRKDQYQLGVMEQVFWVSASVCPFPSLSLRQCFLCLNDPLRSRTLSSEWAHEKRLETSFKCQAHMFLYWVERNSSLLPSSCLWSSRDIEGCLLTAVARRLTDCSWWRLKALLLYPFYTWGRWGLELRPREVRLRQGHRELGFELRQPGL